MINNNLKYFSLILFVLFSCAPINYSNKNDIKGTNIITGQKSYTLPETFKVFPYNTNKFQIVLTFFQSEKV